MGIPLSLIKVLNIIFFGNVRKALVNLEIDTAKLIYETVEHRHMTTLEWLNKARLLAVELKVGGRRHRQATPH